MNIRCLAINIVNSNVFLPCVFFIAADSNSHGHAHGSAYSAGPDGRSVPSCARLHLAEQARGAALPGYVQQVADRLLPFARKGIFT